MQDGLARVFDVDEFLVLHKHPDVNAFLSAAPAGLTAVACNWKVFGSGGAIASSNELVISRFRRCARTSHPKNRFCKSIVQPGAVKTIRVHTVELSHGVYGDSSWRTITLPSDVKTASVCHSGAQLNHYLLKSWEEFERKRLRGNAARAPEARDKYSHRGTAARPPQSRREKRDPAHDYWVKHDLNMRYDASALRWLPQVISRLQEWDLLEDRWTAVAARPRIGLGRSLWRRLVARPLA